ncbi:hypothetical protein AVEN_30689-1 [Araneus ventricosus]|uniref:Uncharacterized protein n=1 Tax=Araneus ventricosus TaxID=182803 RepID=A0A4Y2T2G7_ARAVE|nr:hypothetical protein AVEN_30689-1 [Araneus ventricosus]
MMSGVGNTRLLDGPLIGRPGLDGRGQMTRTKPELAPLSPSCATHGKTFGPDGFCVHLAGLHGGSSVESVFGP